MTREAREAKDLQTTLMMLDIDGVLTQHQPDTEQMMTAAQAIATSAIGHMTNQGADPDALHRFANLAADQIRDALHRRINEGRKPEWDVSPNPRPIP